MGIYIALFGVMALWSAGIIYYCLPGGKLLTVFYVLLIAAGVFFRKKRFVHGAAWGLLLLLNIYYISIEPTNDREWKASWSRLPYGKIENGILTMQNIRNFTYRTTTDFDVNYETREYRLDHLETVDFAACYWDGMKAVAHVMLSFGFGGGQYLVLSAETRLAEGDIQGSLPGLYKRFGFQYIFATEEDIFALRTNYRHEDLFLYQLTIPREKALLILEDLVLRANKLNQKPEFYNTVTNNCLTGLLPSIRKGVTVDSWNPVLLFNGFMDKQIYERGGFVHQKGESFDELKKRASIPYDISAGNLKAYSQKIREHAGIMERE